MMSILLSDIFTINAQSTILIRLKSINEARGDIGIVGALRCLKDVE
ncbi:MAG: hypothetical protein OCD01_14260 [Fibrobacterales bacterium]